MKYLLSLMVFVLLFGSERVLPQEVPLNDCALDETFWGVSTHQDRFKAILEAIKTSPYLEYYQSIEVLLNDEIKIRVVSFGNGPRLYVGDDAQGLKLDTIAHGLDIMFQQYQRKAFEGSFTIQLQLDSTDSVVGYLPIFDSILDYLVSLLGGGEVVERGAAFDIRLSYDDAPLEHVWKAEAYILRWYSFGLQQEPLAVQYRDNGLFEYLGFEGDVPISIDPSPFTDPLMVYDFFDVVDRVKASYLEVAPCRRSSLG